MIDDFEADIPTCHYCERIAPEFWYEGIAICENCMENMSAGKVWHLVRTMAGDHSVTSSDTYMDFEVLAEGTFKEMWKMSLDMGEM